MNTPESAPVRDLIQALYAFHISTPTDAFVQGWRKLPDELKLEIIRHALPSGMPFNANFFKGELPQSIKNIIESRLQRYPHDSTVARIVHLDVFRRSLIPLLACPETASFVDEALYTQNSFNLCVSPLLPSPAILGFIRHVHMYATVPGEWGLSGWWDVLMKIADGSLGLSNLHVVEIEIDSSAELVGSSTP
jgi:hypothetical protein